MRELKTCPDCGEEKLDVIDLPDYSEGVITRSKNCWNPECEYIKQGVKHRPLTNEDKKKCANCGSRYMPDGITDDFCGYCKENKIFHNVYAHNFGIIVPGETGVVYEQQTAGVMCNHVHLEGSYIPLRKPTIYETENEELEELTTFDSEYRKDGDLLTALRRANYNHAGDETLNTLWNAIRRKLGFNFSLIDTDKIPENGFPPQEGIRWIRINKVDDEYPSLDENLEGEIVCMVYPNCD